MLSEAEHDNIAFLVVGDPFGYAKTCCAMHTHALATG